MRKPKNCQHGIEITTCRPCFRLELAKEEGNHNRKVNKAERKQG